VIGATGPLVFREWLNTNESRAYPIHDRATRRGTGGELPNNLIADAHIWLPLSAGRVLFVSSAGISAGLVSLTFLAADKSTFCPPESSSSSSSSSDAGFVPIAVLSVARPVTRFKNYAITPLYPGVGGWVALGSAALDLESLALLFDGPAATQLADRAVHAYNDIPVSSLGKINVSSKLTGLVRLHGAEGTMRTFRTTKVIGGVERAVAAIGLDLSADSITALSDFAGPCGHRPVSNTCNKTPITEINGVKPDCDGNIDIEFVGDENIGDTGDGLILDYPVGLSQACGPSPFRRLPTEVTDVCGTPIPSSSSSASPVSSSSSSMSSSSQSLASEYCEAFGGDPAELTVVAGSFSVQSGRYVSQAAYLAEQYAIDFLRLLDANNSYIVKSTIRPRTTITGEGHLIFGYNSGTDFFFAGFTYRASASFPNGRFFIGRRVASGGNWPNGLGSGYQFLASYAPPVPLIVTDYRVFVEVTVAGLFALVRLVVTWTDGGPQSIDQTLPISLSLFNTQGYAGLGVVASESEFDEYGINCDGSSSSF
jgi:hypothetical protein